MKLISQFCNTTLSLIGFSIIFIYLEFSAAAYFPHFLGVFDAKNLLTLGFLVIYTGCCFFLMPAFFSKIILKEKLKNLGLQLPDNKIKAIVLMMGALILLVPYIIFCSHQAAFKEYSLESFGLTKFIFINVVLFPPYYFAQEFFFRGFLFINLWNKVKWHSFWITDVIYTLSHVGKPFLEILLCIPASVILNTLTLNTKSIYPAIIVHCLMGVLLSVLITFRGL